MRRLLFLVGGVVFVDTMFFAALTPLLPDYADQYDLSKAGAGILAGAYPIGVLIAGIPGGIATARFGARPITIAGSLVTGIATFVFATANAIVVLDAARFTQGIGSAFTWAAGLTWLVGEAPAARRGLDPGDRGLHQHPRAAPRRQRQQSIPHVSRAVGGREQLGRLALLDQPEAQLLLEERDLLREGPGAEHVSQRMG